MGMNFNLYLDKDTASKMAKIAKKLHRSRNSIVREAINEWIDKHQPSQWPKGFFDFEPLEIPDFKQHRKELIPPSEDTLA